MEGVEQRQFGREGNDVKIRSKLTGGSPVEIQSVDERVLVEARFESCGYSLPSSLCKLIFRSTSTIFCIRIPKKCSMHQRTKRLRDDMLRI